MFILWLYQNLFWPNLVWHLTCHIIVKILESCLITVCVLWSWFLFAIVLCVCARARVCEGERVWVFFVCLFCMPCVEWVWMFLVLLFYVIYSRTIASIANVFCWLYPTLNKVYLILSYLINASWVYSVESVSTMYLVLPYFAICGVVCVKQAHSSSGGREDIFVTHFVTIIKSGVSTFPIVDIFFRGCVPQVVVPSYAVRFIYIPGKLGFVPLLLCTIMVCEYDRVHYDLIVVFVCLRITLHHYHHYADVSESIELVTYILTTVCLT